MDWFEQLQNNNLKRPITKLCVLPIDNDSAYNKNTEHPSTEISVNVYEFNKFPSSISIEENQIKNKSSSINPKISAREYMRGKNTEHIKAQAREFNKKCTERKPLKRRGSVIRPYIPPKLLFVIMSICAFICPSISDAQDLKYFHIQPFTHQPGIYFEELGNMRFQRNEWNLIIHYDLKIYKSTLQQIQNMIISFKELCHDSDSMCNSLYSECKHLMFNINTSDIVLQSSNKNHFKSDMRLHKRGLINGIGYIANELFGILDSRAAEKYEAEINELKTNNKYLIKLAQNHTFITDATLRLFSENTELIKQELSFLNTTIREIREKSSYTSPMVHIILKLIMTMMRIQNLQDKMLNIILDTQHGKFNPILLPPHDLLEELKHIRANIPANVIIPDILNGNLADLYNMMTIKTRITENNIIFSVKIPLSDIELHEIFKLIPLPITYQGELLLITPSSEYLIINNHRDHFYPSN